jgi:hypothetical protein
MSAVIAAYLKRADGSVERVTPPKLKMMEGGLFPNPYKGLHLNRWHHGDSVRLGVYGVEDDLDGAWFLKWSADEAREPGE